MNRKKRTQLIILFILLLITAAAFGALKGYLKNAPDEEGEVKEESYSALAIDSSQVTDIGLIGSKGNINLVRTGEGFQSTEDESLAIDDSAVELFLSDACSITASMKIEDVEDMAQYGLDAPSVNLTLQWDNNMYTVKLGDYNSIIGGYYLNVNDENTVYVVSSSVYYALDKSLEDFKLTDVDEESEALPESED